MFNKPAKFEKQLSRGAISVSKDANHTGSPTSVISKSTVEEVQSVNDGEDQKVDKATTNKLAENIKPNHVRWCVPGTMLCVPRILITSCFLC